ncbi:hypothetical protein [Psychrobacter sp. BF1]|uniref:hypothetical protein n=1 Tax=Psychrobacter sp. BF1 TaxID=2821147 RepID=UPI001C4E1DF0|nr:hypothetical protein [Psychrobacter sp. BF1]
MLLDCSTFDTALSSICKIFDVTEVKILRVLSKVINDEEKEIKEILDDIYFSVISEIGIPNNTFEVLWFHGTRVKDINSFHEYGILTKKAMYPKLCIMLKSLSGGLVASGSYINNVSVSAKSNINDEGPFAFMIRCLAIAAPDSYHNYTQVPELVEDIAGSLLGENYYQLVSRFQNSTIPCLVSFTAKPIGNEVSRALFFLKLVQDGKNEIEASSIANIFFDSLGDSITVDRIIGVERL